MASIIPRLRIQISRFKFIIQGFRDQFSSWNKRNAFSKSSIPFSQFSRVTYMEHKGHFHSPFNAPLSLCNDNIACTNDISRWKEVSFSSNACFSRLLRSFSFILSFYFDEDPSLILLSAGRLGNNTWRLEDNTWSTREESRGRRSRNLSIRGEERAKQSRRQLQITFERAHRFKFKFPLVF